MHGTCRRALPGELQAIQALGVGDVLGPQDMVSFLQAVSPKVSGGPLLEILFAFAKEPACHVRMQTRQNHCQASTKATVRQQCSQAHCQQPSHAVRTQHLYVSWPSSCPAWSLTSMKLGTCKLGFTRRPLASLVRASRPSISICPGHKLLGYLSEHARAPESEGCRRSRR